ncbi:hypothetical protein SBDP1_1410001 [Syntrophobacter sp. SbD1]|nr:hypothetical protein SBDP1_1410001 [Syntrophobacter sp. SbD1]
MRVQDRTPNYKRLTWARTFNAGPEQSEGSPPDQIVELRPGCQSVNRFKLSVLRPFIGMNALFMASAISGAGCFEKRLTIYELIRFLLTTKLPADRIQASS